MRHFLFGDDSWLKVFIKVCVTLGILLAAYLVFLDSKLQRAFSELYQPQAIELHARHLVVKPGIRLQLKDLAEELEALNYHRVSHPTQPNQYAMSSSRLEVYLNQQANVSDPQSRRVLIRFEGARVVSTYSATANQPVDWFALPPVVLDKIWAGKRQDRQMVNLDQVPDSLVDLLLMVEDRNFYTHWGINPIAIGRALLANIKAGHTVQGGSTLTQQLAKNLLLTRERSLIRKLNEAFLALLMELRYSKEQILTAYLNETYLGQSGATAVHGFGTAAQFYFGKPLNLLNLEQQVALVAMVKGPSYYNPWSHAERLAQRRDLILRMLLEQENLDIGLYQRITERPVPVIAKSSLRLRQRPTLVGQVKRELEQRLGERYQKSYQSVQTTVDPLSQRAMETVARRALSRLEKRYNRSGLQLAMLAIDVDSGAIRALVSDRRPDFAGFNRVRDAQRPIGSLLKPVIVLAALENKPQMTLATVLNDRPVSMRNEKGRRWQPQNYDKKYHGSIVTIDALARSLNVPFVNLGMSIGLDKVQHEVSRLSGQTIDHLYPSDLLGSISLSPWQVAQIYSTIASQGVYQPLFMLKSAAVKGMGPLLAREPSRAEQLDPSLAYQALIAMQQVVKQGTAKKLQQRFPGVALSGKTGTTNDYRDAWFVGIDGRELVVTWVGRDDNAPINMTGSQAAMQLYMEYLDLRRPIAQTLTPPSDIEWVGFDAKGRPMKKGCQGIRSLPIDISRIPNQYACEAYEKKAREEDKPWWQRVFDL